MSDIIDINVTPTLEQVEITVTENLTTVNVNTNFGVDAYTKSESNTIFAPINNPTFTGNVVVPDATSDNEAVNLGQLELNTVSDISELIAYSGASTTLVVKDTYRGGVFNYDSTSTTVDNGITFIATGKSSGRWVRDTSNAQGSHVNWYGAKGDWNMTTNTGSDNAVAIQACINSRPNRNTCVVFDYGVYGSSTEIQLGEGTYLKGMSTLFPYQQFGDGSIIINYTNMTAVKFYNNTHGFVTTLDVVSYRSQGIKIEGLGIFGSGKANGKTGLLLRQTANSTFPVKTTGLVSTNYVYLSEWTIGADGTSSTDSWYVNNSHFSECKTGLIGGSGQTFINFTDFFRIDDYGFILNSANEPDVVNGCEVETRFCSQAAALINGRVIINATQFVTIENWVNAINCKVSRSKYLAF